MLTLLFLKTPVECFDYTKILNLSFILQDAVILLNSYSLKDSEQVLHHVIQLFVETTRLEALPVEQMTLEFPG